MIGGTGEPPAAPGRDPGLQAERTRLAWRRTTLSAAVVAVLAVRTALREAPSSGAMAVGAACCALWLAFTALAHARVREIQDASARGSRIRSLALPVAAAVSLCTVATAACGMWLAV
ncbi:DUF202 domain-containing protein [Streptomyces abyssomicinicus]|uniref:DUF202 domain-containing protein n=1 Tax=Streptomyces abyssomicinicus TaxID=574929 RepID=UPI00124FAB24|nr:DUF202 domain-containing protein [Streptomyces abyssomicinicus]